MKKFRYLKKYGDFRDEKTPVKVNQYFIQPADEIAIKIDSDANELWSYVDRKNNQRWTWYAVERTTGVILAWHNGRCTDESCSRLMAKLSTFPVTRYYTDDWQSYRKHIPASKHLVGKADTWRIERRNLRVC
jgi:insertion element IS1 protein InsB